jgi:hypothetical protein
MRANLARAAVLGGWYMSGELTLCPETTDRKAGYVLAFGKKPISVLIFGYFFQENRSEAKA